MLVRLTPYGKNAYPKSPAVIGVSTDRAYLLMKNGMAAPDKPFMEMYEENNGISEKKEAEDPEKGEDKAPADADTKDGDDGEKEPAEKKEAEKKTKKGGKKK